MTPEPAPPLTPAGKVGLLAANLAILSTVGFGACLAMLHA